MRSHTVISVITLFYTLIHGETITKINPSANLQIQVVDVQSQPIAIPQALPSPNTADANLAILKYEKKPHDSILKCLQENPQTSELSKLLSKPEYSFLMNALNERGVGKMMTYLAPSNEALQQLTSLNKLTNVSIKDVLLYHLIPGIVPGNMITSLHFAPSVYEVKGQAQGIKLARTVAGQIQISSGPLPPAIVINPDLQSINGLVHVIDRLVIPPYSVSETLKMSNLTHFLDITTHNDLIVTMDRVAGGTIFAPTNEALESFAKTYPKVIKDDEMLYQLAKQHFAPSQVRFSTRIGPVNPTILTTMAGPIQLQKKAGILEVNDVKVKQADLITRFGVLHILDGLLNANQLSSDSPIAIQEKVTREAVTIES